MNSKPELAGNFQTDKMSNAKTMFDFHVHLPAFGNKLDTDTHCLRAAAGTERICSDEDETVEHTCIHHGNEPWHIDNYSHLGASTAILFKS